MALFPDFLAKAKALTTQGKLMDATRAIQQGLGFRPQNHPRPAEPAVFRETLESPAQAPGVFTPAQADQTATDVEFRETVRPTPDIQAPTQPSPPQPSPSPSSFGLHSLEHGQGRYGYRLFVPGRVDESPIPLVVMLHGCKQDAGDFAKGTAMNELAEREKFMVLYPEQPRTANSMGCWNWFDPAHQARERGEPAMIAALTRHVASSHGVDPARIYVAGLSAGAAMAAIMGQLYPEIFAAVGVHSGLAPGAAHSVASAFSAMSKGPGARAKTGAIGIPVIIFQGSGDSTVAQANADAIIRSELGAWSSKGLALVEDKRATDAAGVRPSTVTVWSDGAGKPIIESWTIAAGPHAWSGGHASGSFTDPKGPSATRAMMDFFRRHAKG
ncbi:MAG: PHB depolymerase family esterase [Polaromonas sp.]